MNLYQEHHFEREICAHPAANGWLHADGDAAHYDRQHGLFLPDLLAWWRRPSPKAGSGCSRPTARNWASASPAGCAGTSTSTKLRIMHIMLRNGAANILRALAWIV